MPEKRKILAVDDDRTMRELYIAAFQEAGYEVQTAEDTTGAAIKYHEFKPDLLVLDVDIQGGSGIQIYDKVKNVLERGTPVIFVTGYAQIVRAKPFAKNPQVSIMEKPVDISALLKEVQRLLS